MRHKRAGYKLGRDTDQRRGLLRNLVLSVITEERIVTTPQKAKAAKPLVEKMILDFASEQGIQRRAISDAEILERCIYPMINEGAKILEEGIALRSAAIDVVWINGYGWPIYRGGPMYYGEQVGLDRILHRMHDFESTIGPEFKPSALLERLVAEGKGFRDL